MSRRAAQAALVLTGALLAPGLAACGEDEKRLARPALGTERVKRASGIEVRPDERVLWGNLVVHATRGKPVELRSVELLGASARVRLRRALVADRRRPQARLLVFGERAFKQLPNYERWQRSLHPLAGYRVRPASGAGPLRDTEIVLELEPVGRGSAFVHGGVRVAYEVEDEKGSLRLPNQLGICAPSPCRPPPPKGF